VGRASGSEQCEESAVAELRRSRELLIGVDIDGVLGDQVTAVSPHVEREFGFPLALEDVTAYKHQLSSERHLGHLLAEAMQEEQFVRTMPVHAGAAEMLASLRALGKVKIVTVRPAEAGPWTRRWLRDNDLAFDEFMLGVQNGKSEGGTDVLIDDHQGNLVEFMSNTSGVGVLVDRPWNRDHSELDDERDRDRGGDERRQQQVGDEHRLGDAGTGEDERERGEREQGE
jgi:uncharacterized HAD superfamily protein